MNDNQKTQLEERLQQHFQMFGKKFSPGQIEIWWRALKQYPLERVIAAIERHEVGRRGVGTPNQIKSSVDGAIAFTEPSKSQCEAKVFPRCQNKVVVNMQKGDKNFHVCAEHFDENNGAKSDLHTEMEERALKYAQEARAMGLTNRQYFQHKMGLKITETSEKEEDEIVNQKIFFEGFRAALGSRRTVKQENNSSNIKLLEKSERKDTS